MHTHTHTVTHTHAHTHAHTHTHTQIDTISSDDIIEYLEKSLNLSSIDHPNVLKVIAVTFDSLGNISIAYHYFEEHDLLTWLKKTRATVSSGAPPKVRKLANRPYSHKLLTINNYVNCPPNFAFARSIS